MRENERKHPGPMSHGPEDNWDFAASNFAPLKLLCTAGDGIVAGSAVAVSAEAWNVRSVGIAGNAAI